MRWPVLDIEFEADAAGEADDVGVVAVPGVARRAAVQHLAHVDVQLLGRDHEEARRDPVAGVALARLDVDRVVRVDRQPRIELGQRRVVPGLRRCRSAGLARDGSAAEAEADDHRAAALQERGA